jgi:hypothetical protein
MRKIRMSTSMMCGSAATSWKIAGSIPDDAIGMLIDILPAALWP